MSDWEDCERELHRRFCAAEAEVMGQELQRLDIDAQIDELARFIKMVEAVEAKASH